MELARTISHGWPVIVNITDPFAATIAHDLGSIPLDAPIIDCLEKRYELVFLLVAEFGRVNHGKRKSPFIACLKIEIRWVEMERVEV